MTTKELTRALGKDVARHVRKVEQLDPHVLYWLGAAGEQSESQRRVSDAIAALPPDGHLVADLFIVDVNDVHARQLVGDRCRRTGARAVVLRGDQLTFQSAGPWQALDDPSTYEVLVVTEGRLHPEAASDALADAGIPYRSGGDTEDGHGVYVHRDRVSEAEELVTFMSPLPRRLSWDCLTPEADAKLTVLSDQLRADMTKQGIFRFLSTYFHVCQIEDPETGMADTQVREAVWVFAEQAAWRIWRDRKRADATLDRLWERTWPYW
jgi:hypothetical protein